MDDQIVYTQNILVAIEFNQQPTRWHELPSIYHIFQRLSIAEIQATFLQKQNPLVKLLITKKFNQVLNERMGYWEQRIKPGQHCYVHYARGSAEEIETFFNQIRSAANRFILIGIYHITPQCSGYPMGFPDKRVPKIWSIGEYWDYTDESMFWFNFFPEQEYLFEKICQIWLTFNMLKLNVGGECNQLVYINSNDKLLVNDVDQFKLLNLNRFTSLEGFFKSAREAGKNSFTRDASFRWYGMLLKKIH